MTSELFVASLRLMAIMHPCSSVIRKLPQRPLRGHMLAVLLGHSTHELSISTGELGNLTEELGNFTL